MVNNGASSSRVQSDEETLQRRLDELMAELAEMDARRVVKELESSEIQSQLMDMKQGRKTETLNQDASDEGPSKRRRTEEIENVEAAKEASSEEGEEKSEEEEASSEEGEEEDSEDDSDHDAGAGVQVPPHGSDIEDDQEPDDHILPPYLSGSGTDDDDSGSGSSDNSEAYGRSPRNYYNMANIGDFDDHWKSREQQAKMNAAKAYDPNPQEACHTLNKQVHENFHETSNNNTRRGLGKYDGHCLAANPIDRCWRCDKHWSMNRQKLADCARGFGHKTTGGKKGRIYVVTDDSDGDLLNPKPGTLRHAVIQDGPLWVTFKHGMVIRLSEELLVSSNKTIDGRGGHVHIAGGAGIMLQYVDNVIIHSVHIHDIKKGNGGLIRDSMNHFGFRTASDGDGISIFGSTNIWIDHVSMSNCMDGLIDAIEASTAITISNCHFTDHNDVMLFGARDGNTLDELMQVTLAFNHFGKRLIQRMPRCRYGFFHVVNNDYTHWEMYAIGGSQHPTIISQGNRFIAPPNLFAKEVTKREYAPYSEWKNWLWTSDEDIMLNGAFFNQSGDKSKKFAYTRQDVIKAKPGSYVKRLTRFAGALNCKEGKAC